MDDRAGGGRIALVSSIASYTVSVNRGEYCIGFQIRPGIIRTAMIAQVEEL